MADKTRRDEYSGGFPDGFEHFEKLEDPRNGRHPRHYFGEIIFVALAAMICGSEGFDDFERFAKARESWLRKRLKLPGGLPSDDTFRRVFAAIDPDRFCECFASFVLALSGTLRRQLVAIDGKTLRHSFDNADPGTSLHLISAWAADNQLTLGQLAVDGKSNEITAVPELIDRLDLEGHTVSLDAMGCQKAIARKLSMAHADYLLALKANHGTLHKRAEEFFSSPGHLRDTSGTPGSRVGLSARRTRPTGPTEESRDGWFWRPTACGGSTNWSVKVGWTCERWSASNPIARSSAVAGKACGNATSSPPTNRTPQGCNGSFGSIGRSKTNATGCWM